jgi:hypothetical protein
MHEVESEVYDHLDPRRDRNMEAVRRREEEERRERLREIKRRHRERQQQDRYRSGYSRRDDDDDDSDQEDVNIGVESRRRPAVEEWDRNKGTRTNLVSGQQHSVKTVGIGDLRVPGKAADQESQRLLHSGRPLDVVCVDGSKSADKALSHALRRLPRNHTFLLLHGNYTPSSSGLDPKESKEAKAIEDKYLEMCEKRGRKCHFVNFHFSSNRNFGERVCQYEKYDNVESIVMGKRAHVSDFRRCALFLCETFGCPPLSFCFLT